jgi:hypothetical protein
MRGARTPCAALPMPAAAIFFNRKLLIKSITLTFSSHFAVRLVELLPCFAKSTYIAAG